ncbi:hypothetical protein PG996_010681 [Apiospora saccharicola]|uniref:Uncharacterized protein n=1 Tax=Apiospora saccharicola TaxID=335842 RepID=A0ABR1UPA3_9PEZI
MKFTTIAASALLPLAWAGDDFDTRKGGHLKWKITNFTAAIGDAYGKPYCSYDMMLFASDNPEFGSGAENGCYSDTGELTGCHEPWDAGAYSMSTDAFPENNTMIITVKSKRAMATWTFPIDDMTKWDHPAKGETIWEGVTTAWAYTRNGGEMVAETRDLEVNQADPDWLVPTGIEWDMASATASGIATATKAPPSKTAMASVTASPTDATTSEPSSAAASSASAKPSDEHSAATRQSAFAGLVFVVGLMALAF